MHVQEHIWMKMLKGKYVWDFDCGEAVRDPFSGWFGVNSVNLVGNDGPPVQLWVLWGTELAKRRNTGTTQYTTTGTALVRYRNLYGNWTTMSDSKVGQDSCILYLVIRFLGPFQHWMISPRPRPRQ